MLITYMKQIIAYLFITIIITWPYRSAIASDTIVSQVFNTATVQPCSLCNEKIYLHTDREIYVGGECVFFKAYLYDDGLRKLPGKSNIAYIILFNKDNNPVVKASIEISGGMSWGTLQLPDTLATGFYQIFAYTNWMRNFGQSSFFHKRLFIANRFDEDLATLQPDICKTDESGGNAEKKSPLIITTDQRSYQHREKVRMKLSLPADCRGNISISVAEKLPGKFSNNTLAENFMTSDGIDIDNHAKSSVQPKLCKYLMEDKGLIISGYVNNPHYVEGIIVTLSTPDTIANLAYSATNASGKFYFQLGKYYYDKDLYISIPDKNIESESTLIPDDKYSLNITTDQTHTNIPDQLKVFIKKNQTIAAINKAYNIPTFQEDIDSVSGVTIRKVYYKPDYRILPEDYIPLNNFTEIVREILPFIRLRKNENSIGLEILDAEKKTFLKDPGIFLNGMLINDINPIINFGSDKITRIEAVCNSRVFGSLNFNGILSVFTVPDVISDIHYNPKALHLPPVGLLNRSHFIFPDYSAGERKNSRFPDFRQTLYWNPSVEINGDRTLSFEFFTSDNKGTYAINVEGITSDGSPLSCVLYFNVR